MVTFVTHIGPVQLSPRHSALWDHLAPGRLNAHPKELGEAPEVSLMPSCESASYITCYLYVYMFKALFPQIYQILKTFAQQMKHLYKEIDIGIRILHWILRRHR